MGSIPREIEYKDGAYLDSISGASLRELKDTIQGASFARRHKDNTVTSPAELLFPEEAIDPRYVRLLFALLDPDVTQIIAPFTWVVLDTIQYLERNYESLVNDIENGQISSGSDLPPHLKQTLEDMLSPNPDRAAGKLSTPQLRILQPETHLLYRDRRMFRDNTAPDQIKPVRVLKTEEQKKFFMALSGA